MEIKTKNKIKELTKTKRITIAVVLALLVIVIGFITLNPSKYTFNSALDKELSDLGKSEFQTSPQNVAQTILNNDKNTLLIDVRNEFEYNKGHLPEAVNIYSVNLMDEKNIVFFEDLKKGNKKAILYGNSPVEANVPFMILKQMGFDNISYLNVGYAHFSNQKMEEIAVSGAKFEDETPLIDYAQFISEAIKEKEKDKKLEALKPKESKPTESKPKTVIVPKKVESGGGEGC